jgi:hypothetical protein
MKKSIKRRALAMLMAMAMLLTAAPATPLARAEETLSMDVNVPFSSTVRIPAPSTDNPATSKSYRIPAMVTLKDGTIVAAADTRWNTTYDGGGLDTLVARSTDGGVSWEYTMANYLGDNGNEYNGKLSTCFIDPCLTVAADGQTVYMLCDLYPYGVALNGNDQQTAPKTTVGFTSEGYLKLSDNDHQSYGYYLKDDKIYSTDGTQISGYTVDGRFNLYDVNGNFVSNLFFADSPYKVVRTGFLYLTKSTDGGRTWSDPTLLNLKTSSEQVCLVGPGRGITTKNGTMVFPVYSFHGDNKPSGNSQRLSFVYSTDGKNWSRTAEFNHNWASEAAVVELSDGTLRFFFRNGTTNLCYVDYNLSNHTWGSAVTMSNIDTNSNTQISAITYSKTANGKQVILVSCPTGYNRAGANDSGAGYRLNGSIFVFTVDGKTMNLEKTIEVNSGNSHFMYSCLTERSDGSVAILFEDKESAWGTGDYCYYTMDMKAYSASALGLTFDEESGSGGVTPEPDVPVDGNEITLQVGQTVKLSVSDTENVGTAGTFTSANGNVQYVVKHFQTTSGYQQDTDGIDSGKQYLIVCSSNYAVTTSSSSVNSWSTESLPLTWVAFDNGSAQYLWTITATNGGYYIQRSDGQYMTIGTSNPSGNNKVTLSSTPAVCDIVTYGNGYMIFADGTNIGLNNAGSSNQTALGWPDYYDNNSIWTLYEYIPQGGTEVEITGLAATSGTVITVGDIAYNVIVEPAEKSESIFVMNGTQTTLDAVSDLGLSGSEYSVSYEVVSDESGVLTLEGATVTTHSAASGEATVLATITNAFGETVGTVTYTITVADVVITDEEDVFVSVGNKAELAGLTGELNTTMLDSKIATVQMDANGKVTITAANDATNIGKHTDFVVGTTRYNIHLVPANEKNTDAAKYIYVNIRQIDNSTIYYSINGSPLHKVEGAGVLIDETFYDGCNITFFAVPDAGYVLTAMSSTEYNANGTVKQQLTDFYSIGNGQRADGTDSDAWPLKAYDATTIPTSGDDAAWKTFTGENNAVLKHGFRWSLMQGNMTLESMRAMFTSAVALGAQGATTITKNDGAGIIVDFTFEAERLPTFEKTIVSVNGQPYTEDTVIEFGNEITYRFTITSYSQKVTYTNVTIRDDLIGFVHTVPAGSLDDPGSYSVTATYTVNLGDVDKYVGGKFHNEANLTYEFFSDYDTGSYEYTDSASVSCDISGMVYYTWADNVPAGITGNAAAYPLPEQAVVTYGTQFQVKPYTGATEYVAMENGVAVGKWTFKGWILGEITYQGGETVNMSSQGSLAFEGVWEYTAYPTYTVTYQWIGAPTTGVTLPTDGGNYYSGQTYRVDGTYTPGHTFTVDGVEYTFNGWKLNGSPVSGQQTMGQSNVTLVGVWTSSQLYTSLVIRKTGAQAIDVNQTFLFRIQGEGVDLTVSVHGDGYAVVEGLKVGGTYTVTEITRWSWRYAFASYTTNLPNTAAEHGATVTLGAESNEITFTCQRIVNWWLDGDHWIDNTFTGKS